MQKPSLGLSPARCIGALLLIFSSSSGPATAQTTVPAQAAAGKRTLSGPYCGVYCLYAAMKLAAKNVDFVKLLKPEYIGSRKGSSLTELKKAAEDHGMHAVAAGNMTTRVLRDLPYPIILHVKADQDSREYDHYVLCLGATEGQAKLLDPPEPVQLVPFHQLAPCWDGTGLIVSQTPVDPWRAFASARKRFIFWAGIALAGVLLVRWIRRRHAAFAAGMSRQQFLGMSVGQCAALLGIAVSGALGYHFWHGEGFLTHPDAAAMIIKAHRVDFLPKLDCGDVRRLLGTDAVFVDARWPAEFKAGHLNGAINIPVNAAPAEREEATSDIPQDTQIVVYSRGPSCPFGGKVAVALQSAGFTKVALFKGGWNQWAAHQAQ